MDSFRIFPSWKSPKFSIGLTATLGHSVFGCFVLFSQKFQNIPFRAHSSKAVPPHAGVVSLKYFVWVNLKYFVYVIFIYFQNVSPIICHEFLKYPELWAGIRYFSKNVLRPAHVLVGTILTAVQVLPKGEHHPCTSTFTIEMFKKY